MKKNLRFTPLILLVIFIFTNPSISSFKEYRGSNTISGLKRTLNLFVCSIYNDDNYGDKYVGFLGNFLKINNPKTQGQSAIHTGSPVIETTTDTTLLDEYEIPIRKKEVTFESSREIKSKENSRLLPPPPKKTIGKKWHPPKKDIQVFNIIISTAIML